MAIPRGPAWDSLSVTRAGTSTGILVVVVIIIIIRWMDLFHHSTEACPPWITKMIHCDISIPSRSIVLHVGCGLVNVTRMVLILISIRVMKLASLPMVQTGLNHKPCVLHVLSGSSVGSDLVYLFSCFHAGEPSTLEFIFVMSHF